MGCWTSKLVVCDFIVLCAILYYVLPLTISRRVSVLVLGCSIDGGTTHASQLGGSPDVYMFEVSNSLLSICTFILGTFGLSIRRVRKL